MLPLRMYSQEPTIARAKRNCIQMAAKSTFGLRLALYNPTDAGMTESDKSETFSVGPAEAQPRSFSQAEMVICDTCLRTNPPTRGNCIYCGAELPLNNLAPAVDAPDALAPAPVVEDGFYLVFSGWAA